MGVLIFSLASESDALRADRELLRNGIKPRHIRFLDRFSYLPAANDPAIGFVESSMPSELEREIAAGRVLLEVDSEEESPAAIARSFAGIPGVRRFSDEADHARDG